MAAVGVDDMKLQIYHTNLFFDNEVVFLSLWSTDLKLVSVTT